MIPRATSPHIHANCGVHNFTISTAIGENELVIDLFCDNLRRFLAGEPLRNVFDRARGY